MKNLLAQVACVAALAFPITAQAVTVNVGDSILETQELSVGGTVTFTFTAGSDLRLTNIGLLGVGQNNGIDLENVEYAVTAGSNPPTTPVGFDEISIFFGPFRTGGANVADINLLSGEVLTILFTDGIAFPIDLRVGFDVAPVPLPAAGGMLLSGLIFAGFVARRRKKQQDT